MPSWLYGFGGGLVAALALAVLLFRERWLRARAEGLLTQAEFDRDDARKAVAASETARANEVGRRDAELQRYQMEVDELQAVLRECTCGSNADRLNRLFASRPSGNGGSTGGTVPQ